MDLDERHDALDDMQILRLPEVLRLIGVSRSTLHAMRKAGVFPAPDMLGPRSVGWPRWVVVRWLASRPPAAGDGPR